MLNVGSLEKNALRLWILCKAWKNWVSFQFPTSHVFDGLVSVLFLFYLVERRLELSEGKWKSVAPGAMPQMRTDHPEKPEMRSHHPFPRNEVHRSKWGAKAKRCEIGHTRWDDSGVIGLKTEIGSKSWWMRYLDKCWLVLTDADYCWLMLTLHIA